MNRIFEALFLAWCPPYDPQRCPEHLRGDPVRADGQYACQAGFRLGDKVIRFAMVKVAN